VDPQGPQRCLHQLCGFLDLLGNSEELRTCGLSMKALEGVVRPLYLYRNPHKIPPHQVEIESMAGRASFRYSAVLRTFLAILANYRG
jgi:hypothetical protein